MAHEDELAASASSSDEGMDDMGTQDMDDVDDEEAALEAAALASAQGPAGGARESINDMAGIEAAHKALHAGYEDLPWRATLVVDDTETHDIPDIHDDVKREVAFYNQAQRAVTAARDLLERDGIPFKRPADYYAEMVKTDGQMGKVKDYLLREKRTMEEAEARRRAREQKLVAKKEERRRRIDKQRKQANAADEVRRWKRAGTSRDLLLEDNSAPNLPGKSKKKQFKEEKFGFGGRKRGKKRNTAESAGSVSDFNLRENRKSFRGAGGGADGSAKRGGKRVAGSRPGKKRRQKMRS